MKKLILATALLFAMGTAYATEVNKADADAIQDARHNVQHGIAVNYNSDPITVTAEVLNANNIADVTAIAGDSYNSDARTSLDQIGKFNNQGAPALNVGTYSTGCGEPSCDEPGVADTLASATNVTNSGSLVSRATGESADTRANSTQLATDNNQGDLTGIVNAVVFGQNDPEGLGDLLTGAYAINYNVEGRNVTASAANFSNDVSILSRAIGGGADAEATATQTSLRNTQFSVGANVGVQASGHLKAAAVNVNNSASVRSVARPSSNP